jgi:hypothetical protein
MPPFDALRFRVGLVPTILAALLALAPGAGAQQAQPYTLELSPPGPGESYGRTACGDFDGDLAGDVAYLRGTSLECLLAPGMYEARMTNLGSANDIDVIQRSGYDTISGVNSQGLVELRMHPLLLPAWPWTTSIRVQGDWVGATKVRAWSVPGGTTYFMGLGAGGAALVSATRSGQGAETWAAGPTITLSPPASTPCEIAAYDRDGDGLPEVAVMTSGSVKVYSPWGATPTTPVYSTSGVPGHSNTTIARLRHPGFAREWLAWVGTLNADGVTQKFLTLGLEGTRNYQLLAVGMGVFALTSGDVDGDGSEDLLAGCTKDWTLTWVPNTGVVGGGSVGPVFSSANGQTCVYSLASAATNKATPIVLDIDNDGDGDIGTLVQDEGRVWFDREDTIKSTTQQPILLTRLANGKEVGPDALAGDTNVLALRFGVPSVPVGGDPAGQYYLSVAVWTRDSRSASLNPAAVYSGRELIEYPLQDNDYGFVVTFPWLLPSTSGEAPGFEQLVYVVAQIIDAPGPSAPATRTYAPLVVLLHGQDEAIPFYEVRPPAAPGSNEEYVLAEIGGDEQYGVQVGYLAAGTGIGLGQDIGLAGGIPDMPAAVNQPPTR